MNGLSALDGCWSSVFIKRIIYKFLNVRSFDYTASVINVKVGIPLTGLTTPIEWMLSVTILINRPKSVPQLLCNRTLRCSITFKSNGNTVFFLSSNTIIPLKISFQYYFLWRLCMFKFQLTVK